MTCFFFLYILITEVFRYIGSTHDDLQSFDEDEHNWQAPPWRRWGDPCIVISWLTWRRCSMGNLSTKVDVDIFGFIIVWHNVHIGIVVVNVDIVIIMYGMTTAFKFGFEIDVRGSVTVGKVLVVTVRSISAVSDVSTSSFAVHISRVVTASTAIPTTGKARTIQATIIWDFCKK